ncbi:MAG: DUF3391 domain-containing protein, partial [Gammaproteobacteria bacterium]|nr:DUF3391 domain-containing protein [Gammaproteobacteria bacterium]
MNRETLNVSQLQPGLFIELPLKWHEHPFLFAKFEIKDAQQVAIIRQLGLKTVYYYPERSTTLPLPEEADAPPAPSENPVELNEAWKEKQAQAEALEKRRREVKKVEKQYNQVIGQVKSLMMRMNSLPAQAISEAGQVVDRIVEALLSDTETVIHLMNANDLDDTVYYHSLNVSVLSLLLAREAGMPEKLYPTLGFAALMHDIGTIRIPQQIVRKTAPLTKPEQDYYEQHVRYGVEMVKKFGQGTSQLVWDVIDQHHEFCDGSGYPNRLKGSEMNELAKIVALVNFYDKQCNHNDPRQSMTPHEALSLMFAKLGPKFEKKYLQLFVKLLGIYPPGTVVQLSDERVGMVISLNREELLKPSILLYDASIPKE